MKLTIFIALIFLITSTRALDDCSTVCFGYSCNAMSKMCLSCDCECLSPAGKACENAKLCDDAKGGCRTLYGIGICCCCCCLASLGACIFAIVKCTASKGP